MAKTLCKSKKLRKEAKKLLGEKSCELCSICKKCGQFADSRKKLCKPEKRAVS
jgi:hypothetical protein